MSKARSPRASCSMTIGTSGIALSVLVVSGRPPPGALAVTRAALLRRPALARRPRRPGRAPRAGHLERVVEPRRQPLQRQLAIARLSARLLGDRGHARPEPRHDPPLLLLAQRRGGRHVED